MSKRTKHVRSVRADSHDSPAAGGTRRPEQRSTQSDGPPEARSVPDVPSAADAKEKDETAIKEVIRRVQQGEHQLFQEVVDRYRSQVAGIAYKMVGDYDDAKDISQMVFVKTFTNIKRFDRSKRFSTWLYRIAVNAAIDYIRKFKRHHFEELDDLTEQRGGKPITPEREFQLKQMRDFVLRSARRLNEKQHMAFVLKDLEGLEIEEIAQIMGMPQATVRWYLHRARKKLRSDLRRRFGPELNNLGIGDGV